MAKQALFEKATGGMNEPMYFPREKLVCNLEGKFGDGNDFPFMVDYFVPDPEMGSWRYFGWKMRETKIEKSPSSEITMRYSKEKKIDGVSQSCLIHFHVYDEIINKNK